MVSAEGQDPGGARQLLLMGRRPTDGIEATPSSNIGMFNMLSAVADVSALIAELTLTSFFDHSTSPRCFSSEPGIT